MLYLSIMVEYEWRSYDCNDDCWDDLDTKQEISEALADDNKELWLYRWTDSHGLTDTAEVKDGKLPEYMPEEGYKVPKRFHQMLERLAT